MPSNVPCASPVSWAMWAAIWLSPAGRRSATPYSLINRRKIACALIQQFSNFNNDKICHRNTPKTIQHWLRPAGVLSAFDHRSCSLRGHVAARLTHRTYKVHNILLGGVDFGRREDRTGLSRLLQCPQGTPGIGLVEEPIAVAGERLSVQTAKIVESQEAA